MPKISEKAPVLTSAIDHKKTALKSPFRIFSIHLIVSQNKKEKLHYLMEYYKSFENHCVFLVKFINLVIQP